MQSFIRDIHDFSPADKHAIEHVIGQPLLEHQRVVIHLLDCEKTEAPPPNNTANEGALLPDWCNIYSGLSDKEIALLDQAIARQLDLTRCE